MQKITTEKIRVRFLRNKAEALQLDGSLINPKYGRPKRVLKYQKWMTYSVQEGDKSIEKEKVVEEWYTSMIKGSNNRIDPTTFITEWIKGPTPSPKPTYEKRTWRAKDIKILHSYIKLSYKKCKELLQEHGKLNTVLNLPEAKEILIKKEQNKTYNKKQKLKVKRGSRETKRQMLDKLRRENLAKVKEIKRLARIEKEQSKVETT